MLLCSDVYSLLLDELRTDKRGLSVGPEEFNRILRVVNQELYDFYISKFEKDQSNSDDLGGQKVHNHSIPLVAGVGTLPTIYYRLIGKPRTLDGTTYRKVDVVTTYEQACRDDDYLTQPTTTYPTCTIGGVNASDVMQIRVSPTTITNVWIDYLQTLEVPYLDYYLEDDTYIPTFLTETSTPQSIPAGYTYNGGTIGGAGVTVTSRTKNLVWDDGDLSLLITLLVNRVAKQLPDELLLQTSTAEQAKADKE